MSNPFIVLGGGGHAKVVIDTLLSCRKIVMGYTSINSDMSSNDVLGVPYLGNDDVVMLRDCNQVFLANGVGSVGSPAVRKKLFSFFDEKGYRFSPIIHPTAIIGSSEVMIEDGVQIMAGAIIQPGCTIGRNTIVNTKSSIDHDCKIGKHVHIAPGATLSGGVTVGDNVHIGAGAVIIEGINIGANSIVGAGAVVINDVLESTTVVGVPAREVAR
ncbi:acetyltransferase [Brevibacillus centrosporus]|uniref:acetyltransferase n=1 Tax=Brevibacillus centrosporus TaxID=54910 RepID=UPI002E1D8A58|nr:acetyltransferase [Brevibacillus centrosporus]